MALLIFPQVRMETIMKTRRSARNFVSTVAISAFGAVCVLSPPTSARTTATEYDAAAAYKEMKCAICHSPKAERAFDPAKDDDTLAQAIIKGATAPKPPNMPAYEAKGIDLDKAKALVAYMKSLRQP